MDCSDIQKRCTRNNRLYKPTTFGSKTSGASCLVNGESAMVGLAESGVLESGRTAAAYERRVSKLGLIDSLLLSGDSAESMLALACVDELR